MAAAVTRLIPYTVKVGFFEGTVCFEIVDLILVLGGHKVLCHLKWASRLTKENSCEFYYSTEK